MLFGRKRNEKPHHISRTPGIYLAHVLAQGIPFTVLGRGSVIFYFYLGWGCLEDGEKIMICPHCKIPIDHVHAYSQCFQKVTIDETGQCQEWSSPDVLEGTQFECPECSEDISSVIKE